MIRSLSKMIVMLMTDPVRANLRAALLAIVNTREGEANNVWQLNTRDGEADNVWQRIARAALTAEQEQVEGISITLSVEDWKAVLDRRIILSVSASHSLTMAEHNARADALERLKSALAAALSEPRPEGESK